MHRDLFIEAGTYTGGEVFAEEWYAECAYNIHPDLDEALERGRRRCRGPR